MKKLSGDNANGCQVYIQIARARTGWLIGVTVTEPGLVPWTGQGP